MRLSDIKGERTLDVIADVIDPVCAIASDEAVKALFAREKRPEGMTLREYAVKKLRKSVPVLIRLHKKEIIAILAAVSGEEDYAEKLTLVRLMKDVTDLLNDRTFMELFGAAQSTVTPSGSAQENTEEA